MNGSLRSISVCGPVSGRETRRPDSFDYRSAPHTAQSKIICSSSWHHQVAYPTQTARKGHFRPVSQYRLTAGAEPRPLALRDMLNVYRVYLENKDLRGSKLLDKIHAFYLGRKRNQKIPAHFDFSRLGDSIVAQRNVRRYIAKAKRITLNVANGEFPGQY
jgi:hypothetical protein